nr:hypothetical protein BaRGS_001091 [Batillaria attramentaria]
MPVIVTDPDHGHSSGSVPHVINTPPRSPAISMSSARSKILPPDTTSGSNARGESPEDSKEDGDIYSDYMQLTTDSNDAEKGADSSSWIVVGVVMSVVGVFLFAVFVYAFKPHCASFIESLG